MKHDERLVEAMAEAAANRYRPAGLWKDWPREEKDYWRGLASAALDAINDSGIAWLAPLEATGAMKRSVQTYLTNYGCPPEAPEVSWSEMRNAHLAEQGDDDGA